MLDEENTTTVSLAEILQALNRAQDYATDLLSRHYPDPLLVRSTTTTVSGQQAYELPEDIFEDKLQKVEVIEAGIAWEVLRISYRDASQYDTSSQTSRPLYYYILGKDVCLLPTPAGGKTIRYWYLAETETMVEPQGRITGIESTYVLVDDLGDDLTTESDNLQNYINIVDAQTGRIKSSHQVQALDSVLNKLTIKATPTRSTVWNRTITGTLSSDIELDDYVCLSKGNCIPYLKKPLSNFIVQYAVYELKRKLGEPTEAEERALEKFEDQVKHQWAGRETQLRVSKRSKNWWGRFRRQFSGN
jgi:hypothetical protein